MRIVLAVALGGALGSVGRYLLSVRLTNATGFLGAGTLAVNILGAFALGLLFGLIESRWHGIPRWLGAGLGVGVLGGFTTFSAYALDAIQHVEDGRWFAAIAYVVATLVIGFAAAVAGVMLGRAAG
jgi:fluoride exporter